MWSLIAAWTGTAYAQAYDGSPCRDHPEWREALLAGKLLISEEGPTFVHASASSHLPPPAGAEPEHPDLAAWVAREDGLSEGSGARLAEDVRGCRYGAVNLLDGHASTAWCEGAPGPGIGEVVVLALPGAGPLRVRNGYGKSAEIFAKNARIRKAEVVLLGAGTAIAAPGSPMNALPVLAKHEVELADRADWQPLPLPVSPSTSTDPRRTPRFVALRILSVWPGTTWEDTCLSEIAVASPEPTRP